MSKMYRIEAVPYRRYPCDLLYKGGHGLHQVKELERICSTINIRVGRDAGTGMDTARAIGDFPAPSGADTTGWARRIPREVVRSAETSLLLRKRGSMPCSALCSESIRAKAKAVTTEVVRMAEDVGLAGVRMAEEREAVALEGVHDAPNAFWSRAICAGSFSILSPPSRGMDTRSSKRSKTC